MLLRLTDVRVAIDGIRNLAADVAFETFAANWAMQRAVERGLEIISGASRHVPDNLKVLVPDIPWRQIAAIRNLLQHEYQRADIKATWNIIEEHPPPLAVAIQQLIVEAERREPNGGP